MSVKPQAKIVGTGRAVPKKVMTNFDFEKMIDTSDEWIKTRTGIETRHFVEEGQYTSDLAAEACQNALDKAGIDALDVDAIILATISADVGFPATACYVQEKINAVNASAMDISAACTGFIYGLELGSSLIASGAKETVLVVGAESLSRICDFTDRSTCVLFGDGAGAVVLQKATDDSGVLSTITKSDGRLAHLLYMPGMGTVNPPSHESVDQRLHFIKMEGREVFKNAVTAMGDAAEKILVKAGISKDQVSLLIPHQANIRIIDATAKRVQIPKERVYVNVNRFGNTSAATIPVAIDEAMENGSLKAGDVAVLVAFGGGLTWGSAAVRM